MSLSDLIRGKPLREVANANPANSAKDGSSVGATLAGLAALALANPKTVRISEALTGAGTTAGNPPASDPPKLPKPAEGDLDGFGGCQGSPILKNDPPADDLPDDCAGALIALDGGPYLPWGPYLAAENVRRLRAGLFGMVDELARAEGWTPRRYADTLGRAASGPLSDLLPNIEYFHSKVIECRAEAEARALLAARSWRLEGFDKRHWCPGCDGSCVGTARSCARRA